MLALLLSLAQTPAPCLPVEIAPSAAIASPRFGQLTAVDGDRLIAAEETGGSGVLDTIRVFERDPVQGGWLEVQQLAVTPTQGERLVDLDLDGNRAVVVTATPSGFRVFDYETWSLTRDAVSGLWSWDLQVGDIYTAALRASIHADDVAVAASNVIRCFRRDPSGWQLFKSIPTTVSPGGSVQAVDLSLRYLVSTRDLDGLPYPILSRTRIPGPDFLPPVQLTAFARGPFGVDGERVLVRVADSIRHFSPNAAGTAWFEAQNISPPAGFSFSVPPGEPLSLDAGSGTFVVTAITTVAFQPALQPAILTYRRTPFGIYELDSIIVGGPQALPPFDGNELGRTIVVGRHHVIIGGRAPGGEGRLVARTLNSGDCDQNGLGDSCDLLLGQGFDLNRNNTLDSCEETGTRYCSPATPNSSGEAARIGIFGAPTTALFSLNFHAQGLPEGGLGSFMASRGNQVLTNPLYTGNLCLGGSQVYRNLGGRQFITETGRSRILLNRPFIPDGLGGLLPILPGETWYFQYWFYDPGATPSSAFTDALGVTFTLF